MKVFGYYHNVSLIDLSHSVPIFPTALVGETEQDLVPGENWDLSELRHFRSLDKPVEIPDGQWMGLKTDSSVEVIQDFQKWKIMNAISAVQESSQVAKARPFYAVDLLQAGGRLIGLSVVQLLAAVESSKSHPTESIEEVFRRIKNKG